jgi:DNA-binding NtrC family response regulator
MSEDWPGNVRELGNRVARWLTTPETRLDFQVGQDDSRGALPTLASMREQVLDLSERTYFQRLLSGVKGNISAAARIASIDRKNLATLLKKRGIDPKTFRES